MALQGVGAALGSMSLALAADRVGRRTLVYGGASVFCVMLVGASISPTFAWSLTFLTLAGYSMIVFGMSAQIRIQEEVPDELRGRVMAVYSLVFQGLNPLGGIEVALLAQRMTSVRLLWLPNAGAQIAIAANGILCLVIAAGLYAWSQAERKQMMRLVTQ
jgi:MFS family permease